LDAVYQLNMSRNVEHGYSSRADYSEKFGDVAGYKARMRQMLENQCRVYKVEGAVRKRYTVFIVQQKARTRDVNFRLLKHRGRNINSPGILESVG